MINRAKLQNILEYARQQRHIGLHCKVPPEDMVEIVEMAMLQGAEPVTTAYKLPPHTYRELVNRLRDIAVKYHGCQQLREQLSRTLQGVVEPAAPQQVVKQCT